MCGRRWQRMFFKPLLAIYRAWSKKNSIVSDESAERFASSFLFRHARERRFGPYHLGQRIGGLILLRGHWKKQGADECRQRKENDCIFCPVSFFALLCDMASLREPTPRQRRTLTPKRKDAK